MTKDDQAVTAALESGDLETLESLSLSRSDFPEGTDTYGSFWITIAVDIGTVDAIRWVLAKGVPLNFREDDGYTILHSAIEREKGDRHEIMQMLLDAGADVNAHGINDWTPLHMAAARDDLQAIKVLIQAGADPTICTRIDDYATAEEEARNLGREKAADYIRALAANGT